MDLEVLEDYAWRELETEKLRKLSVQGVLAQPPSSKDVLTDKQRTRTAEVRTMLAEGRNPFTKEELDRAGKNHSGPVERISLHSELSPKRVQALEKKWGNRDLYKEPEPVYLDDLDLGAGEFPSKRPDSERDPAKLYCSFCDKEVDQIHATHGKGDPRLFLKKEHKIIHGEKVIDETWMVTAKKFIACPDCVLNIGPGIKFPDMEG